MDSEARVFCLDQVGNSASTYNEDMLVHVHMHSARTALLCGSTLERYLDDFLQF